MIVCVSYLPTYNVVVLTAAFPSLTDPNNTRLRNSTDSIRAYSVLNPERQYLMNRRTFRLSFMIALCVVASMRSMITQAQQVPAQATAQTEQSIPFPALLQAADLAQMLNTADKPLVLQIGSHILYAEAHVPGSEYVGAAGTSAGLQALRERISRVKKDRAIVIYCGCCPWGKCPNIRPAYELLQTLGFTHVKALKISDNFGTDWVDKGYPVAKGR